LFIALIDWPTRIEKYYLLNHGSEWAMLQTTILVLLKWKAYLFVHPLRVDSTYGGIVHL
jgi:hypothetical protein